MPLVRKPPPVAAPASAPLPIEGTSDARWAAARAAAGRPDGVAVLAAALAREDDPRVREAIFTGLDAAIRRMIVLMQAARSIDITRPL